MRNVIISKPSQDDLATVGSIDNKPPDKAAAHRAVVLRNSWQRADTSWQQWQEQLANAMKERIWEKYPNDAPAGDLTTLLEKLDIDPKFALSREKFSDRPIGEHGGDRRSEKFQVDNIKLKEGAFEPANQGGTSVDYNMRRLRRYAPELAEQVFRGELSVSAAAIKAGFRQRKYQLPGDPIAAGRYLAQRVDREWFDTLIDAYYKAIKA